MAPRLLYFDLPPSFDPLSFYLPSILFLPSTIQLTFISSCCYPSTFTTSHSSLPSSPVPFPCHITCSSLAITAARCSHFFSSPAAASSASSSFHSSLSCSFSKFLSSYVPCYHSCSSSPHVPQPLTLPLPFPVLRVLLLLLQHNTFPSASSSHPSFILFHHKEGFTFPHHNIFFHFS